VDPQEGLLERDSSDSRQGAAAAPARGSPERNSNIPVVKAVVISAASSSDRSAAGTSTAKSKQWIRTAVSVIRAPASRRVS